MTQINVDFLFAGRAAGTTESVAAGKGSGETGQFSKVMVKQLGANGERRTPTFAAGDSGLDLDSPQLERMRNALRKLEGGESPMREAEVSTRDVMEALRRLLPPGQREVVSDEQLLNLLEEHGWSISEIAALIDNADIELAVNDLVNEILDQETEPGQEFPDETTEDEVDNEESHTTGRLQACLRGLVNSLRRLVTSEQAEQAEQAEPAAQAGQTQPTLQTGAPATVAQEQVRQDAADRVIVEDEGSLPQNTDTTGTGQESANSRSVRQPADTGAHAMRQPQVSVPRESVDTNQETSASVQVVEPSRSGEQETSVGVTGARDTANAPVVARASSTVQNPETSGETIENPVPAGEETQRIVSQEPAPGRGDSVKTQDVTESGQNTATERPAPVEEKEVSTAADRPASRDSEQRENLSRILNEMSGKVVDSSEGRAVARQAGMSESQTSQAQAQSSENQVSEAASGSRNDVSMTNSSNDGASLNRAAQTENSQADGAGTEVQGSTADRVSEDGVDEIIGNGSLERTLRQSADRADRSIGPRERTAALRSTTEEQKVEVSSNRSNPQESSSDEAGSGAASVTARAAMDASRMARAAVRQAEDGVSTEGTEQANVPRENGSAETLADVSMRSDVATAEKEIAGMSSMTAGDSVEINGPRVGDGAGDYQSGQGSRFSGIENSGRDGDSTADSGTGSGSDSNPESGREQGAEFLRESVRAGRRSSDRSENIGSADHAGVSQAMDRDGQVSAMNRSESSQFTQTMNRAERFQEVMEHLDRHIMEAAANDRSMTIQLIPANLGKMELKCSEENGVLRVEVVVENSNVKNLLLQQENPLKQTMENSGCKLAQFDVRTESEDPGYGRRRQAEESDDPLGKLADEPGEIAPVVGEQASPAESGEESDNVWYVA